MRLAVPLWVFSFGIRLSFSLKFIKIRYDQGTGKVGNYFFRIPTDKLRPLNWGFPSATIPSPRREKILSRSS